jgi:quercetin dioxygenase-like cupin family protein
MIRSSVQRIWRGHGPQPHRVRQFKLVGGYAWYMPISVLAKDEAGITHTPLLKSVLPGTSNEEVIVWDAEYSPRAVNPRHLHPAAITFRVLSGTGIWQRRRGL